MLGASGTNVTTTPGGGPVPWTEDAVSSYVASVTKGELTVTDLTDCVSDGEDITQNFFTSSFLQKLPLKQSPPFWSPFLLAQLLVFLEELLNLHPFVRSPLYQTKFSVSDSFKIWDPPHSTLGSSVMLSPATLKVFSSCSSKLVTIPRLHVSSSELLIPRFKL